MRKGDLRREQIIDAAEQLFFEKGYDQTSIQDILDTLSMSKGGFYHYFDSKSAILREICERRLVARFERLNVELYGTNRSPIDRMDQLLRKLNVFETETPEFAALLIKVAYIDEDFTVKACLRRLTLDTLKPFADEIVKEGMTDGSFFTRHPSQLGRMLLTMAWDADDAICAIMAKEADHPEALLEMFDVLDTYRDTLETMLGIPFGALRLFEPSNMLELFRTVMAKLQPKGIVS